MTKKRTSVFRQSYYKVTHIITSTPKPLLHKHLYSRFPTPITYTYITISNFPSSSKPVSKLERDVSNSFPIFPAQIIKFRHLIGNSFTIQSNCHDNQIPYSDFYKIHDSIYSHNIHFMRHEEHILAKLNYIIENVFVYSL